MRYADHEIREARVSPLVCTCTRAWLRSSIRVHRVRYARRSKFIRLDSELFAEAKEWVAERGAVWRTDDFFTIYRGTWQIYHCWVGACETLFIKRKTFGKNYVCAFGAVYTLRKYVPRDSFPAGILISAFQIGESQVDSRGEKLFVCLFL